MVFGEKEKFFQLIFLEIKFITLVVEANFWDLISVNFLK